MRNKYCFKFLSVLDAVLETDIDFHIFIRKCNQFYQIDIFQQKITMSDAKHNC